MIEVCRRLSGVERLWLAADRISPPFVNQMVLEFTDGSSGGSASHSLEPALRKLAHAHPGASCRLKGWGGSSRWESGGALPEVRRVEAPEWDGTTGEGAPFLREPLDPRSGPVVELLCIGGRRRRWVLRTHHAATDGRGTLQMALDLFRILRGEEPEGAAAGPLTDFQLASESGRAAETPPQRAFRPLFVGADGGENELCWARVSLPGGTRSPLPRLLSLLADQAGQPCCFDIPVDMRRHAVGASSANLTGLVRLAVDPGEEPAELKRRLSESVGRREEADFVLGAQRVVGLPVWFLAFVGRRAALASMRARCFETSGTISNLGRLDPALLSCEGLDCERVFFIPPGNQGLPLFMTLTGGPAGVELCATVPRWLITPQELQGRLADLGAALAGMG